MCAAPVREALEKLTRLLAEQPEKARAKNAPAVASLGGGLKFRVSGPIGEQVDTDMPAALGGGASAPNPGWLLRAATASCTATVIAMRAAQQGVSLRVLEVMVASESDNRGILGLDPAVSAALQRLSTRVKIAADNAAPEQLREIVAWAQAHSPVGCTLRGVEGPASVEIV